MANDRDRKKVLVFVHTGVTDRAEVIARTECGFALHSPLYYPLPQP